MSVRCQLAGVGHIGAGAEGPACAGDQNGADLIVVGGPADGVENLAPHVRGPRVQSLGPVQLQVGDARVDPVADTVVGRCTGVVVGWTCSSPAR